MDLKEYPLVALDGSRIHPLDSDLHVLEDPLLVPAVSRLHPLEAEAACPVVVARAGLREADPEAVGRPPADPPAAREAEAMPAVRARDPADRPPEEIRAADQNPAPTVELPPADRPGPREAHLSEAAHP